ncbi:MAG: putative ABC transporter permease [Eggerthellaceae bacterium]|nr:putative ABC transporter permease [Eggerthellaceae bacterium]
MNYLSLSHIVILFLIFSFIGWIWETIYRSIMEKKWQKSGFLYGPLCPIYGFSGVAVFVIAKIFEFATQSLASWYEIFLLTAFSSALIEYTTSWFLEKKFHALWWDYSHMPFNIHGRISLFSTLFFGLAGVLAYNIITPIVLKALSTYAEFGAFTAGIIDAGAFLCIALISFDAGITISSLTDFSKRAQLAYEKIEAYMQNAVETTREKGVSISERISEEQERFARQIYDEIAAHMQRFNQSSVMRIQRFSHSRAHMMQTFEDLKQTIIQKYFEFRNK